MKTVHLVQLRSTGEVWHIAVCENLEAARQVMRGHGITALHYASDDQEFMEFRSALDPSQTATVSVRTIVRDLPR